MKAVLLGLALISFLSFGSEADTDGVTDPIWYQLAELGEMMLDDSRGEAQAKVNLLNDALDKIEDLPPLLFEAWFEKLAIFYEYHGTRDELKNHLEENVYQLSESNPAKYNHLSHLAILQFKSDEIASYKATLEHLRQSEAYAYVVMIELMVMPSELRYDNFSSFCTNQCISFLHDQTIANYYLKLGHYQLLETFSRQMVHEKYPLSKEYGDIRGVIFTAYYYVSKRCQNLKDNSHEDLYTSVANDIRHLIGLLRKYEELSAYECK